MRTSAKQVAAFDSNNKFRTYEIGETVYWKSGIEKCGVIIKIIPCEMGFGQSLLVDAEPAVEIECSEVL